MPKLFTYNELADKFNVTTSTIRRWFRPCRKFKPTLSTVRIPETEVVKFLKENTKRVSK